MLIISVAIVIVKLSVTYAIIRGSPSARQFTVRLSLDEQLTWNTGTVISASVLLTARVRGDDSVGNNEIKKIAFKLHYAEFSDRIVKCKNFTIQTYSDILKIDLLGAEMFPPKFMEFQSIKYNKNYQRDNNIYHYYAIQTPEGNLLTTVYGRVKLISTLRDGVLVFQAIDFVPEMKDVGGAIVDQETNNVFGIILFVQYPTVHAQSTNSVNIVPRIQITSAP